MLTEEMRPSPHVLLGHLMGEELRKKRGKLKIFFGYAPGVGKTHAMLEAGRARSVEGVDIVVGTVETHGRPETEALLKGLEVLPQRFVEHQGARLREFDLDAAMARRPAILLVDELAHTNTPGSRHQKRWQDVNDLLEAGVTVYTTLGIQHLESLKDAFAQMTGVVARETIPDLAVEQADEIALVDLPPDDLLERLREGKVYIHQQGGLAVDNFFRKGNLIAWRELAMRAAAERVDQQGRTYRQEHAIRRSWRTSERLLVCVSSSPFSTQLVRAARRMAAGLHAEWIAANVKQLGLSEADRERLVENLGLAEQLGAEIVTLIGPNVVEEIVKYARQRNVTKIIAGKPGHQSWRERLFGAFVDNLIRASGDIDVYVIKGECESAEVTRALPTEVPIQWTRYGWAALSVVVCTAVAWVMHPCFDLSNLIMVYLLGSAVIAARFGRGPAILGSVLSVAAFDFFLVPPYLTFAVADSQYLVTFAVMLAVAVLISSMAAHLRRHVQDAVEREQRTASLYNMSRQLSSTRGTDRLLYVLLRNVAELFQSDAVALMPDSAGQLVVSSGSEVAFPMDARERAVAYWAFDLGRAAGLGTGTVPNAEGLYVPLNATRGPVGVLGLRPVRGRYSVTTEFLQLIEAYAAQAGLAIESDQFAQEAYKAQVEAETEKSRNALLNSVSHDLRTPLSAITGAASSIVQENGKLSAKARRELAETINEEAERLSRLVANLLEMTRLESGAARVKKELCPIEEIIGSALARLEKQLSRHRVVTSLPADLPPIPLDVLLMEQVLINLLENAAKYAPAGSLIEISAAADGGEVTAEVADRGPGISSGDEKKIFEKFYRGKLAGKASGVGLGLSICRAVVEAHGGRIWAENRVGGGASFRLTLPLGGDEATQQDPGPQRDQMIW